MAKYCVDYAIRCDDKTRVITTILEFNCVVSNENTLSSLTEARIKKIIDDYNEQSNKFGLSYRSPVVFCYLIATTLTSKED